MVEVHPRRPHLGTLARAIVNILSHREISVRLAQHPICCLVAVTRLATPDGLAASVRPPGPHPFSGSRQVGIMLNP